jgi:hypothetical protein
MVEIEMWLHGRTEMTLDDVDAADAATIDDKRVAFAAL